MIAYIWEWESMVLVTFFPAIDPSPTKECCIDIRTPGLKKKRRKYIIKIRGHEDKIPTQNTINL